MTPYEIITLVGADNIVHSIDADNALNPNTRALVVMHPETAQLGVMIIADDYSWMDVYKYILLAFIRKQLSCQYEIMGEL